MGYQMPIVCKEVVLPFANGDTVDGYKEKYGIDINDYLFIDVVHNSIDYKDNLGLVKLTVAVDSGELDYGIIVDDVHVFENTTEKKFLVVRPVFATNGNNTLLGGLAVTLTDGEFNVSEI